MFSKIKEKLIGEPEPEWKKKEQCPECGHALNYQEHGRDGEVLGSRWWCPYCRWNVGRD